MCKPHAMLLFLVSDSFIFSPTFELYDGAYLPDYVACIASVRFRIGVMIISHVILISF